MTPPRPRPPPPIDTATATATPTATAVPEPVVKIIGAGVGVGTVSGNVYTPSNVTVPVGSILQFTINSDEVHSITFLGGDAPPSPPPTWPVNLIAGEAPEVDGTRLLNTGLLPYNTNAYFEFPEVGAFPYICIIHNGMAGTITVVEAGEPYTPVAEATSAESAVIRDIAAAEEPLRAAALEGFTSTEREDGTSLWEVPVCAFQLTDSGPLELLEYFPPEVTINAGDTIRWSASNAHSVTFVPEGEGIPPGNPTAIAAAKPGDEYDPGNFYHSGVFTLGPPGVAPTSFELTFPAPGSYPYLCVLHWEVGHTGTVVVE